MSLLKCTSLLANTLLVAGLIALGSSRAGAQDLAWEQLPGPPGGGVYALHRLPEGRFVARVDGRVFRSDDDGRSWHDVSPPTPDVATLTADADGVLFASDWFENSVARAQRGVFRSTDGGATWTPLQIDPSVAWVYTFLGGSNGYVFAATDQGLFRSNDQGQTWSRIEALAATRLDAVATNAIGAVAVLEEHKIYLSEDDGATWHAPISPPEDPAITRIAVRGDLTLYGWSASVGLLHRSTDGGLTWMTFDPGVEAGNALLIASCGKSEDYYATSFKTYRTDDLGATWEEVAIPFLHIISCARTEKGELLVGTGRGVYRQAGADWEVSSQGMTMSFVNSLIEGPDGELYAGGYFGDLWRSDDGGQTWALRSSDIGEIILHNVSVSPLEKDILAAVVSGEGFRSMDGGLTWEALPLGKLKVAFFTNQGTLLTVGSEMFRSVDKGETWTAIDFAPSSTFALNQIGGTLYAATADGIYVSIDDGLTWQLLGLQGQTISAVAVRGPNLYASVENLDADITSPQGIIYHSNDGGETWTEVLFLRFAPTSMVLAPDGSVYASGRIRSVLRSTDDGNTWEWVSTGLPDPDSTGTRTLVLHSDGYLYVGTFGRGVFRTTDLVRLDADAPLPAAATQARIEAAFPNPFRTRTTLTFTLAHPGLVTLTVYDALGRRMRTLAAQWYGAGSHALTWNASDLPGGVYFCRLTTERSSDIRAVTLIR
ncbi:T9SS type A sorting domain-containing protein [Rhodocaloribacter sp.]